MKRNREVWDCHLSFHSAVGLSRTLRRFGHRELARGSVVLHPRAHLQTWCSLQSHSRPNLGNSQLEGSTEPIQTCEGKKEREIHRQWRRRHRNPASSKTQPLFVSTLQTTTISNLRRDWRKMRRVVKITSPFLSSAGHCAIHHRMKNSRRWRATTIGVRRKFSISSKPIDCSATGLRSRSIRPWSSTCPRPVVK